MHLRVTVKPVYPFEEDRRWPLGLSPAEIEETLMNLPVGHEHEPGTAQLDAMAQWIRVRDFVLQIVHERADRAAVEQP